MTSHPALARRSLLRGLVCVALLLLSGNAGAQYTNSYHYDDVERWGVVGEPFDEVISTGISVPPPQIIYWHESNPAPPPGLTVTGVEVNPPFGDGGVHIQGTPTTPGFHIYSLQYYTYRVSGVGVLRLILFKSAEARDTAAYYTDLMKQSSGVDYFYWAALRGYSIGLGVDDEGLALYGYYASLGDYYYVSHAASSPQYAAYYYWYYRGLAAYYYYDRHGDSATAQSQFAYYVNLANGSL